jgi:hypothetical protein
LDWGNPDARARSTPASLPLFPTNLQSTVVRGGSSHNRKAAYRKCVIQVTASKQSQSLYDGTIPVSRKNYMIAKKRDEHIADNEESDSILSSSR